MIVTTTSELTKVPPPRLPDATLQYDPHYIDQLNNILRLYFNRLSFALEQLMANTDTLPVSIGGTNTDAFGRIRVSQPYTLFDSQSRYAADNQFDTTTSGTGSYTFNTNQSSVSMSVTAGGVGSVVRRAPRDIPCRDGEGCTTTGCPFQH